jgi:hypothetical protein
VICAARGRGREHPEEQDAWLSKHPHHTTVSISSPAHTRARAGLSIARFGWLLLQGSQQLCRLKACVVMGCTRVDTAWSKHRTSRVGLSLCAFCANLRALSKLQACRDCFANAKHFSASSRFASIVGCPGISGEPRPCCGKAQRSTTSHPSHAISRQGDHKSISAVRKQTEDCN